MNRSLILASAVLALGLIGCGGGGAASPAASGPAASAGSPGASQGAEGLRIAARDIKFDRDQLTVPAGTPFQLVFQNQEAAPHNVAINGTSFVGEVFSGPAERTYEVPAIPAGSYTFVCTVHPNMTGTLTAR